MKSDNFIIFTVIGGAGKNILATAVVKAIKKAYPSMNIIVVTSYPDVWLYNPIVYKTYLYGQTNYFYSNYIKDKKNVKIFNIDPYLTNDFYLNKKHLIEIWCDLVGVPFENEKPELFFNQREVEFVKKTRIDNRKIFLIQTNGGAQTDIKVSWMRDLPLDVAQEVVNHMKNEYRVIHVRREDQPGLDFTEPFQGGIRELFSLIRFSDKRLFIDSICQHAAAALSKESTVTWVRNSPEMYGYPMHNNIITSAEDELDVFANSFLVPYSITGNIYECPFKEGTKLFDVEEILQSIIKQKQ